MIITALGVLFSGIYLISNILILAEEMGTDDEPLWAPVFYTNLRKYLNPFGALVPTVLMVCFTLIYQILKVIGRVIMGVIALWMVIFSNKEEQNDF